MGLDMAGGRSYHSVMGVYESGQEVARDVPELPAAERVVLVTMASRKAAVTRARNALVRAMESGRPWAQADERYRAARAALAAAESGQ